MEGFSAAANVITVIQAANAVINICYNFRAALKKSPWALTRVLEEVTALRSVLERIELSVSSDQGPSVCDSKALQVACSSVSGPLPTCLSALSHLEGILSSSMSPSGRASKFHALAQAVTWQLKDDEFIAILGRIERCKSTLSLAISTEEW
jgi:hypothetical protein